jgi:hypothetical protein
VFYSRRPLCKALRDRRWEATSKASATSHRDFRNTMMTLYTRILKFQATYVCYLSGKMVHRLANDVVKWSDWEGLMKEIIDANNKLNSLDKKWTSLGKQEDWELWIKRHEQDSRKLGGIQDGVDGIQSNFLDAQRDKDRSQLLEWLRTVGENVSASDYYNSVSGKRGKLKTGNWLLADPAFKKWESGLNKFLWLHGKGNCVPPAPKRDLVLMNQLGLESRSLGTDIPNPWLLYLTVAQHQSSRSFARISQPIPALCGGVFLH